jgi:GNAT superfamily N-acetyltransferase
MKGFSIRVAAIEDIVGMHRIRTTVTENALSDPTRVTLESYRRFVATGEAWLAEDASNATIAGFAITDLAAGNVWALFVDPAYEGYGVGRALHDHMLDAAVQGGRETLWLTTTPGTRAHGFYERRGWLPVGRTEDGETRFEMTLRPIQTPR